MSEIRALLEQAAYRPTDGPDLDRLHRGIGRRHGARLAVTTVAIGVLALAAVVAVVGWPTTVSPSITDPADTASAATTVPGGIDVALLARPATASDQLPAGLAQAIEGMDGVSVVAGSARLAAQFDRFHVYVTAGHRADQPVICVFVTSADQTAASCGTPSAGKPWLVATVGSENSGMVGVVTDEVTEVTVAGTRFAVHNNVFVARGVPPDATPGLPPPGPTR